MEIKHVLKILYLLMNMGEVITKDGTLRMNIEEKELVEGSFTFKINYVEMPLDKNKINEYEMYLRNEENEDKEIIISNIA
ncbi:6471_t:CDS:2 [Funneliformis geosporum]|uniref:4945_t:CDS:1 n=1 Tax=Funneliformis geosporum TaxID=1117311 RepID=A0A9W4SSD1_9GLOM|nr:6471_t:CDS:2 [Funneliformis geosporum]CAI2179820.1 4945_t:CDS:2 [Funneliformis geosporum]